MNNDELKQEFLKLYKQLSVEKRKVIFDYALALMNKDTATVERIERIERIERKYGKPDKEASEVV